MPVAESAGIDVTMEIVQTPGAMPVPATTVPPDQLTTPVPGVAVKVPPEHPAPSAVPLSASTMGCPPTGLGRLSVKLTLLAAPPDQLLMVMVYVRGIPR